MITEGVVDTLIWLKAKGYDVPELITREELVKPTWTSIRSRGLSPGLANAGYYLMEAIKAHMPGPSAGRTRPPRSSRPWWTSATASTWGW
jgi:hypothetical protein